MNEYDGTFVCVEGIDGSGKGTLIEKLRKENEFSESLFTQEPSSFFYGHSIRDRLRVEDEPSPADFFAFLADRYQHCTESIKPTLQSGRNVICDRYALSTFAYQTKVLDEELGIIDPIQYIQEMSYHFTIEPDLYLYLSVDVDTALERIDTKEKYEDKESLVEAKRIYDYLASEKPNVVTIDGEKNSDEVFQIAKTHINGIFD